MFTDSAKAKAAKAEAAKADAAKADATKPCPTLNWSADQIRAWGDAQKLTSTTAGDRTLVFRQMHMAVLLILAGCALAILGLVLVKTTDTAKLTAIVSLGTAVIGSGAALLPTGAAAGAAARILNRDKT